MRRVRSAEALDARGVTRALAQLLDYVKRVGLKSSAVREQVARAALRQPGHFTVESLAEAMRSGGAADVHLATLYRTLPVLVDAGLLQVTTASTAESAQFERAFEREHHDHLICRGCGVIVEFNAEAIEAMQRDVAARFGFELDGHVHELFGRCRACRSGGR